MNRSPGHCMTMGTASTMASHGRGARRRPAGATPRFRPSTPAATCWRAWPAGASSRWCSEDLVLSKILTREAFENAIRTLAAIGGSTNAVVHLLAIAGRVGVELTLDDFDRLGRDVHCLVDLMPSGRFLMEDFYYAGGLPVVLRDARRAGPAAQGRADGQRPARSGRTSRTRACWNREVITPFDEPFKPDGGHRRSCAATSRRTARSSSPRPPRRT